MSHAPKMRKVRSQAQRSGKAQEKFIAMVSIPSPSISPDGTITQVSDAHCIGQNQQTILLLVITLYHCPCLLAIYNAIMGQRTAQSTVFPRILFACE